MTAPVPKPERTHDSVSSLREFERCGVFYRFHRIDKIQLPSTPPLVRGTAFHEGAAANMRQKMRTRVDLSLRDVLDRTAEAVDAGFAGGISLGEEDRAIGYKLVRDRTVDEAVRAARVYHLRAAPFAHPLYVERRVRLQPPPAVYPRGLVGVIDLATLRPAGEVVEDHKTGRAWTQAEVDSEHGSTFYAMLHKAASGKLPARLAINNLVLRPGREPLYVRLETTRSMDDVRRLILRLRSIRAAIDAGNFTPAAPTSWWCSEKWCGYWEVCPFARRRA